MTDEKTMVLQMPPLVGRWIAVALSYMLANLDDLNTMNMELVLHDLMDSTKGPANEGEIKFAHRLPTEPELESILHYMRVGYTQWGETEVSREVDEDEREAGVDRAKTDAGGFPIYRSND